MTIDTYALNPASRALLLDLGMDPINVLRRAGLPADLFSRGPTRLSQDEFFSFWRAFEVEAADPNLPLRMADVFSPEVFDPAIFAALASPNLDIAAQRIAKHKPLIGPMTLAVDTAQDVTTLSPRWPRGATPPATMVLSELLFWVVLVRTGTRHLVTPLRIVVLDPPVDQEQYKEYLGVSIDQGSVASISFAARDAARPFLMANDAMWAIFEPDLRRRLSEIEQGDTYADRVKAALLELLPAGNASKDAVAQCLAVSARTLQRRLQDEGTSFQAILNSTRESLARHYLTDGSLSTAEIAFLLGYDESTSFYRAFHSWTGQTPDQVRAISR